MNLLLNIYSGDNLKELLEENGYVPMSHTPDGYPLTLILFSDENKIDIGSMEFNPYKDMIYLRSLTVYEELRGKGYGKEIVSTMITIFKKNKMFNRIELESVKESIGFWVSCGFSFDPIKAKDERVRMVYHFN